MALEFMKIPGLQKILTALDFKSYLIGVDKLPDYRNAEYCTYFITEDATARSGKLYYDKVPRAKGGYEYNVCSHFKMGFSDTFASMKYYEFNKVRPIAMRLYGSTTAEGDPSAYLHLTITKENKLETVDLASIVFDSDKYAYYRRNIDTGQMERLSCAQSGSNTFIRAQGNFYGRETASDSPPGGWSVANNTYWSLNSVTKVYTAINNSSLAGSIADYETANSCQVFVQARKDTSVSLNVCTLYNCGWYLGVSTTDTIYDVDVSMGSLSEYTMPIGTALCSRVMASTSDIVFAKNKSYYVRETMTGATIDYSNGITTSTRFYNVTWLFSNYRKLIPGVDYGYTSIAEWRNDPEHPERLEMDLVEENSNYWLQSANFVGELTRNHDWYERAGDRFPYVGFVAIATSNFNGQMRGGLYHAVKKEYALTEDEVHHFRWKDDQHTAEISKVYYEWDERTNVYTPRDGDASGAGRIYRLMDGSTYFQKPEERVYLEGKTYYNEQGEEYTGWITGQPVADNVRVADRQCFYKNGWTITPIANDARYGVTVDVTPVPGKDYFVHTEGNIFSQVPDDKFYTITADPVIRSGKQYYYITKESKNNVGINKFVEFPSSDYLNSEVNKLPYTIYENNKNGEIPTEVQFCVPFGIYTSGGESYFDGIQVPSGVEIVVESKNGEAILPDCYYEQCYGMYVWEQYFIERGVSVTKPYNVTALYVVTGSGNTKITLNLMWTDPKFMLHQDDPTASPDAWAKTDVLLEYTDEVTHEKRTIRLASEVGTNDVYSEQFLSLTSNDVRDFSDNPVDETEFKYAVQHGKISIIATANTGIHSEYVVRPSKVVWVNSEKSFVQINPLSGVAVEGVEYYTINGDGKEVKVADVVPYTTDVSGYYVKYQDGLETYELDESTSKYNLLTIGTASYPVGTKVEGKTLYTRITENPEMTIRDIVRAGLFGKLFTTALSGHVGSVLGECPIRTPDGTTYGNANVTVVDCDGAALGYNIEQGYMDATTIFTLTSDLVFDESKIYFTESNGVYSKADVVAGDSVTADTYYEMSYGEITLDPNTTYYAKKCVTLKACADESKDVNEVYYDLVPVVDLSVYGDPNTRKLSTRGVLFTRTHPNPHYNIYINTKNQRVNTGRFELDVTYSIRKANEVQFVVLNPDYRGPNTAIPDPYNVQYYYAGEELGTWDDIDPKDVSIKPSESYIYLSKPANGKGIIIAVTTDETFIADKRYYKKEGTIYTELVPGVDYDPSDSISDFGVTVYCDTVVDVDTDTTDFDAVWEQNPDSNSTTYTWWRFKNWAFKSLKKYYIHYNSCDYEIGDYIADWSSAHSTSVYKEKSGVNEYLDVTSFGMDALRGCPIPLYVKDIAIVDGHRTETYVALMRPAHNVTFRYNVPLPSTSTFGTILGATEANTYWDNSLVRANLRSWGEPDASIATGYKDYCEFYENHIIPTISTVFKNWHNESYETAQVFDKFWIPCLGNFAENRLGDIEGIPSEGGPLDLYTKGIGQAYRIGNVKLGRTVRTGGGVSVDWFIRTCPKSTSPGVVGYVDANGNFMHCAKSVAKYIVPHFTIA